MNMTKTAVSIVWFRQDLRLGDNPALTEAAEAGRKILPIYILDDKNAGPWKLGAAKRVWLHHSLQSLSQSLDGKLSVYCGAAEDILQSLCEQYDVEGVYWNRCYEPWRIKRDTKIKEQLDEAGIDALSFNGSLLWEPWEVSKPDGTPYRVFSPFYYRGCNAAAPPRQPLPVPEALDLTQDSDAGGLDCLKLLPVDPRWDEAMMDAWAPGEEGALERANDFIDEGLNGYKAGRDFPTKPNTSRLSPYLQTGEISPNTVWHAARDVGEGTDLKHFCSELGWREFSYYLLYHFPTITHENHQQKFDHFPWHDDPEGLTAWQRGQTGVPIIDAGMRQLYQTGYMHNRIRMVVGSFLVKNLMIDWRDGEKWFWDTLVDADLASNSASWQWVAGSGADAAPYFRIFNPVSQAQKFDKQGGYIREYVPELAALPDKHLAAPWEAPEDVLKEAGIVLGETYPQPVVNLKTSRQQALDAFSTLKQYNKS